MAEQLWVEHLDDIVRAARVLETMTEDLNKDSKSDLTFWVPTEVKIGIDIPDDTGWSLILEDDTWYLKIEEDK